jgi:hypothetical protein
MSNTVIPYEAQFIVIIADPTKQGLSSKLTTVKGALGKMGGIRTFEPAFEISALNYYNAAIPGWSFDSYRDLTHPVDHINLVNLLPVGATPKADLANAEMLWDGDSGNLVGMKTFSGSKGSESPLLSIMTGSAGSGKSQAVNDILVQTEPYFDYTCIVDVGNSYGVYTKCVEPGAEPYMIRSNGNWTFNPFDTRGLPLSNEIFANVVAILGLLAGKSSDEERRRYREGVMLDKIKAIYLDFYRRFAREHPAKISAIAREALVVERWETERNVAGEGYIDAFVAWREFQKESEDEAADWLNAYSDAEIKSRVEDPFNEQKLLNLSFAWFSPEEFPQLHDVVDEFDAQSRTKKPTRETEELGTLAVLLRTWLADGQYGPIVDGVSNIKLDGKIVHFELGQIKESESDLLAVTGFLITNDVRNHMMSMPRGKRKRLILEELTAFLELENGPKIVADFYARMRKYNCWVLSILQQFASIKKKNAAVLSVVVGNALQVFILKSNDKNDLDALGETYPVAEVTKRIVMQFPKPSGDGPEVFSGMALLQLQDGRTKTTIVRNYAHDEMLYISSSTGSIFEQRAKELRGADDVLETIIENVKKKNRKKLEKGNNDEETH